MIRLLAISLVVVLPLSLGIVLLPAQSAMVNGTTIHVPTTDYQTIQAGIDAASSGDTVSVAAGTYAESITMEPGVTIEGSGADVTTIQGDGSLYQVRGWLWQSCLAGSSGRKSWSSSEGTVTRFRKSCWPSS